MCMGRRFPDQHDCDIALIIRPQPLSSKSARAEGAERGVSRSERIHR